MNHAGRGQIEPGAGEFSGGTGSESPGGMQNRRLDETRESASRDGISDGGTEKHMFCLQLPASLSLLHVLPLSSSDATEILPLKRQGGLTIVCSIKTRQWRGSDSIRRMFHELLF